MANVATESGLKLYEARSIPEFLKIVESIAAEEGGPLWFRGHAQARYRLVPSVLRDCKPSYDARMNPIVGDYRPISNGYTVTGPSAEHLLGEFKKQPFFRKIAKLPKNDFEWLFLMQHYGVPTRLIDWSTNALVALYFSLKSEKISKFSPNELPKDGLDEWSPNSGAVFVMNPETINDEIWDFPKVVNIAAHSSRWQHYVDPVEPSNKSNSLPICIKATVVDERIRSQFGAFTIHGCMISPLDYYTVLRPLLHKILIPHSCMPAMKKQLKLIGMTKKFLLPDLMGLQRSGIPNLIVKTEKLRFDESFKRWRANEIKRIGLSVRGVRISATR